MSAPSAASPSARRARPSDAGDGAWEDHLLSGVDRLLTATMGTPGGSGGRPPDEKRPRRPGKASWKRATAIEGVGVLLILLFVMIGRPGSEAADVARGPDGFAAPATGVAADGAVVLGSGVRIHLLGISMPTEGDAPVVRSAAFEMLDRLVRGRRVYVEFDPVLPSDVQRGQDMTVAYVWVLGADGQRKALANTALLARGLARPVTSVAFARQNEFVRAAAVARQRSAGVWRQTEPELGLVAPF